MYTNSGGISINKIGTPIGRRYMTLCTYVHIHFMCYMAYKIFFDATVCFFKTIKGAKMKYSRLKFFFLFCMVTGSESTLISCLPDPTTNYEFVNLHIVLTKKKLNW